MDRAYMINKLREVASRVMPADGQVWLYGSQARGDANADSDWDLLILINKVKIVSADEDNISYPFVFVGWQNSAAVSPIIYTYSEWQKRSMSPFYQNVERDKILISKNERNKRILKIPPTCI